MAWSAMWTCVDFPQFFFEFDIYVLVFLYLSYLCFSIALHFKGLHTLVSVRARVCVCFSVRIIFQFLTYFDGHLDKEGLNFMPTGQHRIAFHALCVQYLARGSN